jgi:hypothetical protein
MLNRVRKDYSRIWRRVCVGWLGWTEARFDRLVRAFDAKLAAIDGGAWFYHEPPLYHILPLLLTDALQERLHKEVRKHRYGTPEWVYFRSEMLMAIEGVPIRSGRFNWAAAKERAEEHLALYREKFPSPKTVTDYEKWVLSFYNPELTKLLHATAR